MAYLEDSLCIGPAMSTPIVAGDGYAYLAVTPNLVYGDNPPKPIITTSLYLLRLNPSGQGSSITLGQWQTPSAGPNVLPIAANLITNADQGALVSWETVTGIPTAGGSVLGATYSNYLTTTSGTSVVSQATTPSLLTPMLQAQDSTFYGIDNNNGNMVKFNQSGHEQWSVPADTPQIATADNGVIGISGITYDSNGNANGQISTPTQSWTANSYTDGPISQINGVPFNVATSFWPMLDANSSNSSAATQQPWYAPLQSCPGAKSLCPQQAIESALDRLRLLMNPTQTCNLCSIYVFSKLPGTSQTSFYNYLSLPPRLFDGTRSYAPANVALCPSSLYNQLFVCGVGSQTVRDYIGQSDAISQTPSDKGKGMQIFFNPALAPCNVFSSSNPKPGDQGVLNQATLFHEALHGYTGDFDNTLESAFGLPVTIGESVSITYYLEGKVIPGGAQGAAKCGD
jgi:hypothetical protein